MEQQHVRGKNYPYNEIINSTPTPTPAPVDNDYVLFTKKLQEAIGAKVDGIVGNETMSKLPILSRKVNPKHKVVKILQEEIIKRGYTLPKWGADGIFGAEMETAIKKYQLNNKLVPDGIVGKNTWKKLLV